MRNLFANFGLTLSAIVVCVLACVSKEAQAPLHQGLSQAEMICILTSDVTETPLLKQVCKIASTALDDLIDALVSGREALRARGFSYKAQAGRLTIAPTSK